MSNRTGQRESLEGLAFGFLGVLGFSFTLPATRLAVASLDPLIVGLGRALVAACLAGPLLLVTRQKAPVGRQWGSVLVVLLGVIVGFPLLSAWAMRWVPASHGAVLLGLLPLATAIVGSIRNHERPSAKFWMASVLGSSAVVGFALASGGGAFHPADLALFGGVLLASCGYAEGARLAREIGGWQVICWALVVAAPLLAVPVGIAIHRHGLHADAAGWAGMAYVSLISMFLAFFAWYRGLALGGVARVSQMQLLQPFLTLGFAALFLGERFGIGAVLAATVVSLSIFISRKAPIARRGAVPSRPPAEG
ncbi:MAG: DMT family transporter [Planctomycetota bacterium]